MTLTLVSVLLALLNLASVALIADRRRVWWLVALGAQIPWTWYDVWTRQFGFLLLTLLYVPAYVRGWRTARHPTDQPPSQLGQSHALERQDRARVRRMACAGTARQRGQPPVGFVRDVGVL